MKTILFILVLLITITGYSQNWQSVTSGTTDEIIDLYFQNETIGFAVAGQGKILKTTNGGENWSQIYENNGLYQSQSIVVLNNTVICFGINFEGVFKKLAFLADGTNFQLTDFVNSNIPVNPISYNGAIYDGGSVLINGAFVPLVSVPTAIGTSIATNGSIRSNGSNLTSSDNYYIYYSMDGSSWTTTQFHPFFLNSGPYQSYWDGVAKMRTVTNYPCVVHISNDNGLTWTYNQINVQSLDLSFITAEKVLGLYLFTEVDAQNKIYYSTDSGINFNFELVSNPVKKIYSYNSNLLFAFGENGVIYKSVNAGGLLSTKEIVSKENYITVFPNPTSQGKINIGYDKNTIKISSIALLNVLGQTIRKYNIDFEQLDLDTLSEGIYYLVFETANETLTKKIIIK